MEPEPENTPKPGDKLTLSCAFIRTDVPTENGSIYSEVGLKKAAEDLNARAQNRTVFGQLGNPPDGKSLLSEASHLVLPTFRVEDGKLVGEIEIMDTNRGRALVEMMQGGMKFTLAPRGVGSKDASGHVGEDFKLKSIDLVPEPPTTGGFGISSHGA